MKLYLKTLTPLHIGTGDNFTPVDYYQIGNRVYKLSPDRFIQLLYEIEPEGDHVNNYSSWAINMSERISSISGDRTLDNKSRNKQISSIRRSEFTLKNYIDTRHNDSRKKFENALEKNVRIRRAVTQINKLSDQVAKQITLPTGEPYIPGSSIKGAIRTALLYRVVKNAIEERGELYSEICGKLNAATTEAKKVVQKAGNDKKKRISEISRVSKVLDDRLENLVLYAGTKNIPKDRDPFSEERFDLLKFLRVGDAVNAENKNFELEIYKAQVFNLKQGKAQPSGISTWHEALPHEQWSKFDLTIDLAAIKNIYEFCLLNPNETRSDWIDFEKKIGRLFPALNLEKLWKLNLKDRDNVLKLENEIINNVLQAVFDFNNDQHNEDQNWYKDYMKGKGPVNQVDFVKPELCEGLLRPGFGAGFISKTIFLVLRGDEKKMSGNIKSIYKLLLDYMEILDVGKFDDNIFPKSRKLISDGGRNVPFNWLLVSIKSPDQYEEDQKQAEKSLKEQTLLKKKQEEIENNTTAFKPDDLNNNCSIVVYVIQRKDNNNMEVQPYFPNSKRKHPKVRLPYNKYESKDSEILNRYIYAKVKSIQKVKGEKRIQSLEPFVEPCVPYNP